MVNPTDTEQGRDSLANDAKNVAQPQGVPTPGFYGPKTEEEALKEEAEKKEQAKKDTNQQPEVAARLMQELSKPVKPVLSTERAEDKQRADTGAQFWQNAFHRMGDAIKRGRSNAKALELYQRSLKEYEEQQQAHQQNQSVQSTQSTQEGTPATQQDDTSQSASQDTSQSAQRPEPSGQSVSSPEEDTDNRVNSQSDTASNLGVTSGSTNNHSTGDDPIDSYSSARLNGMQQALNSARAANDDMADADPDSAQNNSVQQTSGATLRMR